jgi:hypothetical protein
LLGALKVVVGVCRLFLVVHNDDCGRFGESLVRGYKKRQRRCRHSTDGDILGVFERVGELLVRRMMGVKSGYHQLNQLNQLNQ